MALTIADRVLQTGSANTTASFTLSGSVSGYQSFAVVGNGNTTYYGAQDGTNWEVGIGTYSTTGPTLTRTTVISSSNSGSAVSTFTSPVTVYVTQPSEYAVYVAGSNIVVPNSAILGTANGGTGLNTFTANGIVFASTTAVLATATGLTWNGTTFNASNISTAGYVQTSIASGYLSSYQAAITTATPGLGTYGIHFNGQTTADYAAGITWNGGTTTTNAQAGIYVQGSGSYGTKMYIATTDSYATGAKTAISIDHTGLTNFARVRPTALGNTILDAGNYSGYNSWTTGTFTPNTTGVSTGLNVVNGDITTYRSGGTTGVIFLGNSGNRYLYYDGTNYIMPGAALTLNGATTLTSSNYSGYSSFSGGLNAPYIGVSGTAASGAGLSLYNGATSGQPQYGIMFAQTSIFGTHGYTTADYATYFTMDATTNRGWIFRDTTNGNYASISNRGNAYFNGTTYSAVYAGTPGVTWGAIQVTGTNGGFAGIYYPSQGGAVNMIGSNSGGATGMYNSSTTTWQWYFTNSNGAQSTLTTGLVSAPQIVGNGVSGSNQNLNISGDITTYRSTTAGVIYLGSNGSHYLYCDGTNYYTPNGNLVVSGGYITANSSINAGTYITATTYFYTPSSSAAAQYVGNWAGSAYWGIGPYSASNDQNIKIGQASTQTGTWGSGGNLIVAGSLSTGNSTAGTFFGSSNTLRVNGSGGGELLIASSTTASILEFQVSSGGSWHVQNSGGVFYITQTSVADRFYINGAAVTIPGSLSKGSGTFDIDHPSVPNMRLRHSFVEGPRVDLIYRGHATLTVGTVTVDMDINAMSQGGQTMTPGTFVALTRDPDIYLQNTTGWSPVKGSINGSKLTIICQDQTSTDTISWMVVAERKDQHLHDDNIEMTDDHGRLILEYKNNRTSGPTQPGEAVHTYHDPNS